MSKLISVKWRTAGAVTVVLLGLVVAGIASASTGSSPSAAKTTTSKSRNDPRGSRGPRGPRGRKGVVGASGPRGSEGAAGTRGPEGPAGAMGSEGKQGPEGSVGPVLLYSSLDSMADALEGVYTQSFNGPQISYFGNEVNLASNPGEKTLGTATVSLTQFATPATGSTSCAEAVAQQYNWTEAPECYDAQVELSLFAPGAVAGTVGSPIGQPVTTTLEVPIDESAKFILNASFDFSSQNLVLPARVVYGVSLPQLVPNDPTALGSLNMNLSSEGYDVTAGSDVYPGNVFVQSNAIPTLDATIGTCPGNNLVAGTFAAVPVMCPSGYARNTPSGSGIQSGSLWMNNIPAISLASSD